MNFLSVTPKLGTLVDDATSPGATLPTYFYLNWKDKGEPFTLWWMGESGERITRVVEPSFVPQTVSSQMAMRSDLLLSRWPDELFFVWYAFTKGESSSRLHAVDVLAEGPSESLQLGDGFPISSAFTDPFAHPNRKVYWTARNFGSRDVVVWDPPGAPQVLASLNTAFGSLCYHRTEAGEDLLISYNSAEPTSSYVVDLNTGDISTASTSTSVKFGLYRFADQAVDQLPGQFGGAYGLSGSSLRGSYDHATFGYSYGRDLFSSASADAGITSAFGSTLRFNHSRKAIACYPFSFVPGNLKWFDISQPSTAPVNSDATLFVEPSPLLDPADSSSFPDQIFPAAIEPFA